MKFFYYSIIVVLSFAGCSISNSNLNGYDSNIGIMMYPKFKVYHHRESQSKLFFKLLTNEVLYTRNNRNQPFQANVILKYKVNYVNNKSIVDSGTIQIKDQYINYKHQSLDTSINFVFEVGKIGSIELNVYDLNRSRTTNKILKIDKLNQANKQFFILHDNNNEVLLKNHFHSDQTIYISSNFHRDKTIYTFNNHTNFPLPLPPFSKSSYLTFSKKTDYAKALSFQEDNKIKYTFPNKGFAYFQLDSLSDDGFTLFNFQENYPLLKNASDLIPPLRYLTTKEEYKLLLMEKNPKDAVDQFWLNKINSSERARNLIRNYYSRVQLANDLFTSHVEGWKTDRGLISIIFGSPSYVRNNKNYETWIYGNDHNSNTIKFTFEKIKNPFSSNDYLLKRSYAYKTPWYIAVENWRSGKVYWLQ